MTLPSNAANTLVATARNANAMCGHRIALLGYSLKRNADKKAVDERNDMFVEQKSKEMIKIKV